MKEFFIGMYQSPKVRAAFWALVGACTSYATGFFGLAG